MSDTVTTRYARTLNRGRIAVVFLVMLLALRLFWVPLHLALEDHEGEHGHVPAPLDAAAGGGGGEVDVPAHEHDHDDDDEHPSHPAADHQTQLIATRVPQDPTVVLLEVADPLSFDFPAQVRCVEPQRPEEAPKPPPPRASRARSPPAC